MVARIHLKYSGNAVAGEGRHIDAGAVRHLGDQVEALVRAGKEIEITIGAGNIFRGKQHGTALGFRPPHDDLIGLAATLFTPLLVRAELDRRGIASRVFAPQAIGFLEVELADREAIKQTLSEKKVVIYAGGTGKPNFTTDSGAALRAGESGAELLVKLSNVDGVYDRDPHKEPGAMLLSHLTYKDALAKNLKIMDAAAIARAEEAKLPIRVLNYAVIPEELCAAVEGTREIGSSIA